jgi:hypothetical protein
MIGKVHLGSGTFLKYLEPPAALATEPPLPPSVSDG